MQNVRVVLASEDLRVRDFLSRVIEQESGVEVIGEAQNAVKALTIVKNLRPDAVVIDSYLPYSVGLDTIPLSRINGLDAAQAIHQEIPNTKVILLNNLDTVLRSDRNLSSDAAVIYSIRKNGTNISLASPAAFGGVGQLGFPVFANVAVKAEVALQRTATNVSDIVVFFGALGFAGGWLLTLTMFLAPVGIPLVLVGATAVTLGLLGKLTTSLWRKTKKRK